MSAWQAILFADSTPMETEIKTLDSHHPGQLDDIVRLHQTLLPRSPVTRLGRAFMRQFYYLDLVADGLIRADLCYHEGQAAGFIVYTKFASEFMSKGLRSHWLRICAVMTGTVIQHPSSLREIFRALALLRSRKQQTQHGSSAEILSFGVLSEFRTGEFIRRTGRRLSIELFARARDYFAAENLPNFRMLVEADNRETLLFYHALGCRFPPSAGEPSGTIEVVYSLDSAPEAQPSPSGPRSETGGSAVKSVSE